MKQEISCPMCHTNDWEDDHWSTPPNDWQEYSVCKECGFDLVFKDQRRQNELRFKARNTVKRIRQQMKR